MLVATVAPVDFVFSLFETTSEIIFCTARFHCYIFRYASFGKCFLYHISIRMIILPVVICILESAVNISSII